MLELEYPPRDLRRHGHQRLELADALVARVAGFSVGPELDRNRRVDSRLLHHYKNLCKGRLEPRRLE